MKHKATILMLFKTRYFMIQSSINISIDTITMNSLQICYNQDSDSSIVA